MKKTNYQRETGETETEMHCTICGAWHLKSEWPHKPPLQGDGWEKDFSDLMFNYYSEIYEGVSPKMAAKMVTEIRDFIRYRLATQREELIEEIK